MEHLFKFLLLAPYFYFDNWIEKSNRNSKFFPIFYYFYWVYIPLYSLFSLAWTVVSVLFFNIVLRNVTDIKFWGIWFLFIMLAIGLNWLTYSCFKKMFRLRRELGKSKGGRHWFILFENLFKPRQRRLGLYMWLTSSVLSTTSKRCFEQPAASFLVCSLIFIEYK